MAGMHEWESRVRNIERNVNDIWEMLRRIADQLGKVQQDAQMTRGGPAAGRPPKATISAVSTSVIAAKPDANTLGAGTATLRTNDGSALANGRTGVVVRSNFLTAIPSGTNLELAPDGDAYKIVAADCPP